MKKADLEYQIQLLRRTLRQVTKMAKRSTHGDFPHIVIYGSGRSNDLSTLTIGEKVKHVLEVTKISRK